MTGEQLTVEMIGLRRRFADAQRRAAAGERTSVYSEARDITDQVICLLDEAPAGKRATINRLANRCEALLRTLAH